MDGKQLTLLHFYSNDYSTGQGQTPASIPKNGPKILLEFCVPVFENSGSNLTHQPNQIVQIMQAHQTQSKDFVATDQLAQLGS